MLQQLGAAEAATGWNQLQARRHQPHHSRWIQTLVAQAVKAEAAIALRQALALIVPPERQMPVARLCTIELTHHRHLGTPSVS